MVEAWKLRPLFGPVAIAWAVFAVAWDIPLEREISAAVILSTLLVLRVGGWAFPHAPRLQWAIPVLAVGCGTIASYWSTLFAVEPCGVSRLSRLMSFDEGGQSFCWTFEGAVLLLVAPVLLGAAVIPIALAESRGLTRNQMLARFPVERMQSSDRDVRRSFAQLALIHVALIGAAALLLLKLGAFLLLATLVWTGHGLIKRPVRPLIRDFGTYALAHIRLLGRGFQGLLDASFVAMAFLPLLLLTLLFEQTDSLVAGAALAPIVALLALTSMRLANRLANGEGGAGERLPPPGATVLAASAVVLFAVDWAYFLGLDWLWSVVEGGRPLTWDAFAARYQLVWVLSLACAASLALDLRCRARPAVGAAPVPDRLRVLVIGCAGLSWFLITPLGVLVLGAAVFSYLYFPRAYEALARWKRVERSTELHREVVRRGRARSAVLYIAAWSGWMLVAWALFDIQLILDTALFAAAQLLVGHSDPLLVQVVLAGLLPVWGAAAAAYVFVAMTLPGRAEYVITSDRIMVRTDMWRAVHGLGEISARPMVQGDSRRFHALSAPFIGRPGGIHLRAPSGLLSELRIHPQNPEAFLALLRAQGAKVEPEQEHAGKLSGVELPKA